MASRHGYVLILRGIALSIRESEEKTRVANIAIREKGANDRPLSHRVVPAETVNFLWLIFGGQRCTLIVML